MRFQTTPPTPSLSTECFPFLDAYVCIVLFFFFFCKVPCKDVVIFLARAMSVGSPKTPLVVR